MASRPFEAFGFRCLSPTALAPLISLAVMLGAGAAQAFPNVIVFGDTATAIQNLDVSGTPYSVLFRTDKGSDVYGFPPPVFDFPSELEAEAAMDAVNNALNGDADNPLFVGPGSSQLYQIGFGYDEPFVKYLLGFQDEGDWFRDDSQLHTNALGNGGVWADFTVVPEPGTAALLGLGLTGLGFAGRSKRQESKATD